MKKFLVLALSLGLCMAFAMPAAAVDVKFSGTYYIQGMYADNPLDVGQGIRNPASARALPALTHHGEPTAMIAATTGTTAALTRHMSSASDWRRSSRLSKASP